MLRYNRKNKNLKIPVGIGTNNNVDSSLLFNVSDGDATAGDLIAGKTAYSAEGFIVGTLDVETEIQNSYNEGKEDGREEIITEQSDANITPASVLEGYIGYGANNERIVGTNVGGYDFSVLGYSNEVNNELNSKVQNDIAYSKNIYDNWNPYDTWLSGRFQEDNNLVYAPLVDTSLAIDMGNMFYGCKNVVYFPDYNYSNVESVYYMFYNSSVKNINLDIPNKIDNFESFLQSSDIENAVIDVRNASNIANIAYNCAKLKYIELKNLSDKITASYYVLADCYNLETAKISGTTGYTSLSDMFAYDYQLSNLEFNLDTQNVWQMNNMFASCFYLGSSLDLDFSSCQESMSTFFMGKADETCHPRIPNITIRNVTPSLKSCNSMFYGAWAEEIQIYGDTSGIEDAGSMFRNNYFTTAPSLNLSNARDVGGLVENCPNLTTIPEYDLSNATTIYVFAENCPNLETIHGLNNLGKGFQPWDGSESHMLNLSHTEKLTQNSCITLFNSVYDLSGTEISDAMIILNDIVKSNLSDEDIAILTNKGWQLG